MVGWLNSIILINKNDQKKIFNGEKFDGTKRLVISTETRLYMITYQKNIQHLYAM